MVTPCEVNLDEPLQTVSAGRAKGHQRLKQRVLDQSVFQSVDIAYVVQVHTQHARMLHERLVVAIAEDARGSHIGQIFPLEFASLSLAGNLAQRRGLRLQPQALHHLCHLYQGHRAQGHLISNRCAEKRHLIILFHDFKGLEFHIVYQFHSLAQQGLSHVQSLAFEDLQRQLDGLVAGGRQSSVGRLAQQR